MHFVIRKIRISEKNFFFAVSSVAALFIAATVFVYFYVKELQTVAGKCFSHFSIGLLVVYVFFPMVQILPFSMMLEEFLSALIMTGAFAAFLWMSVLSFDVWWTLRLVQRNP